MSAATSSRALIATAAIAGAAAVSAGCGSAGDSGDCLARVRWDGREYTGIARSARLPSTAARLSPARLAACGDAASRALPAFRLRGVDPRVAIGVRLDGSLVATLRTGYLPESPEHPLHRALYRSGRPRVPSAYRCDAPFTATARVAETPAYQVTPARLAFDDASDARRAGGRRTRGVISVLARSRLDGFDVHGSPRLRAGEPVRARLRLCRAGPGSPPGLHGLEMLSVVRLARRSM